MSVRGVRRLVLCMVLAMFFLYPSTPVMADPSASTNYRLDESTIGAGGFIQSSSSTYKADAASGDLAIGNSASSNYQVEAGSVTTHEPTLSFIVNAASNFSTFSASSTATATSTFSVSNYTSYGYVVQIMGDSPTNGSHVIPGMSSTTTPTVGQEEFGINLVANTAPTSFGANPDHGQFGFGSAATNYDTPNSFRYVSGETIASSPKTSGVTLYTISYVANVAALTPGGQYKTNQTLVVTGTY